MIFEPNGMTDDKDIRIAQSLVDYLARRLAIDYLDVETRHALGIKTTAERTAEVNGTAEPATAAEPAEAGGSGGAGSPAPAAAAPVELQQRPAPPAGAGGRSSAPAGSPSPGGSSAPVAAQAPAFTPGMAAVDAPYCSTCGVRMRPAGSCFVCESCGTTSGCS
jgi:ribonucleoside-diphosphate reductase alpha chain